MSEATHCCGTTCDKSKLRSDQSRVVSAFDALDKAQQEFNYLCPDIDALEKKFMELKAAIACLRERP